MASRESRSKSTEQLSKQQLRRSTLQIWETWSSWQQKRKTGPKFHSCKKLAEGCKKQSISVICLTKYFVKAAMDSFFFPPSPFGDLCVEWADFPSASLCCCNANSRNKHGKNYHSYNFLGKVLHFTEAHGCHCTVVNFFVNFLTKWPLGLSVKAANWQRELSCFCTDVRRRADDFSLCRTGPKVRIFLKFQNRRRC